MAALYESFMEQAAPFLQQNWQLFVIAVGGIFLLGAAFGWKWVCDPYSNTFGFLGFVYRNFGETAYRIAVGAVGLIIIACGILLWYL